MTLGGQRSGDARQRRSDRKRLLAIAAYFIVGPLLIVGGVWWGSHGGLDDSGGYHRGAPGAVALFMVGVVVIVLGGMELAHRLWFGPQKPGRHARDD